MIIPYELRCPICHYVFKGSVDVRPKYIHSIGMTQGFVTAEVSTNGYTHNCPKVGDPDS